MQRRSGTRYKEVLREEEAIYIPLLNSLEQLLNKTSILQEVSLLTLDFSFCEGLFLILVLHLVYIESRIFKLSKRINVVSAD